MTAGNGAYSGGTLSGGRSRTHQGLLVASLDPPAKRYVILEEISEFVSLAGTDYDLESAKYRDGTQTDGYRYLKKVTCDGTVKFDYELRPGKPDVSDCESGTCAMSVSKHMALLRNENTLAIDYHLINYSADDAEVYLTPKFSIREHDRLMKKDELDLDTLLTGDTLSVVRDWIRADLSVSEGEYLKLRDRFEEGRVLPIEVALETEGICDLFMPYDIRIVVSPGEAKHVSVTCSAVTVKDPDSMETGAGDAGSVNPEQNATGGYLCGRELLERATDGFVVANTARKLIEQVRKYYSEIEETALAGLEKIRPELPEFNEQFFKRLVLDADHFIVDRASTGYKSIIAGLPWFTDWGRDTMISFTGLTLCTGRFDDARDILKSFAMYERNGLIPNMFPDSGSEPLYNTADASLWYFIAVYDYLRYRGHDEDYAFIKEEIYPILLRILHAYEHGTDNDIHMEDSGLVHAGSGIDQVTWMDVRIDGVCVTPRHGCPVEINALWYNALRIGADLAERFGDKEQADHCSALADKVKAVYEKTFYNDKTGCLYDVAHPFDDSIRPNQLYAVSLPYSPVSENTARQIVDTAKKHLYAGTGIRSLAPDDPKYRGFYRGSLKKRDLSYHQGTSWGFLLGAYICAYAKVHAGDPDIVKKVAALFDPVMVHQTEENCIGSICEVFEGDSPHAGGGCYAQAWSTGEILRAYIEAVKYIW